LPGGYEESHEENQSGKLMCWTRFEPNTFRMQV
jgi:hypothetical protein